MPKGVYQHKRGVYHHSDETRRKIGSANKGHVMSDGQKKMISLATTGRKHSAETIAKMSLIRRGRKRPPFSDEWKRKMKESSLKNPRRYWLGKKRLHMTGDKNWNWQGGITPILKKIRGSIDRKIWRNAIFLRDSFTCQNCGVKNTYLHAHHVKSFSKYPELRFDLNNGITLCKACHKLTDNYAGREKTKRDK